MASSPAPAVRVLQSCRVTPSRDGLPPVEEASLPLTFFDLIWIGSHPVERLFFYHWPVTTAHFLHSFLPRLTRALSLTLRHYYPLAGRLRLPPGSERFEIHCTDRDSVPFTLAECNGDFSQLASDHARGVGTLRPLVADIPATDAGGDGCSSWASMALQVTVFPGAGVCVGVSIRHAVCDGSGFTGFVKAWAAACRSPDYTGETPAGALPITDRTLVSDPNGLYKVFWNSIMEGVDLNWTSQLKLDGADDVVRSTFLLRRTHIEKLRRRLSERGLAPPRFRYSAFVLTCAHVWVCLLKSGEQPAEAAGDAAYFFFAVDHRSRLRPPLPAAYFGNCLGPCFVDARRSELMGEGGVGRAAEAIAESIARMGEHDVLRGAEEWITNVMARAPGRPLSVAGSPRFGVYGVDFGWGRPAKVEVMGIERTGAIALAESREEEGGMEIGLALPAPVMSRFGSLFAAGLVEDPGHGREAEP